MMISAALWHEQIPRKMGCLWVKSFFFSLFVLSPQHLRISLSPAKKCNSLKNVWTRFLYVFFSLQVNFNEPLSMLQRLTEDLEYHELLDRAAKCENSLEQLCYVAAFTVSSYSTTVFRTSKPFNPLLGETFELDRLEENGYRSLCEQVRSLSTLTHFLLKKRMILWTPACCL